MADSYPIKPLQPPTGNDSSSNTASSSYSYPPDSNSIYEGSGKENQIFRCLMEQGFPRGLAQSLVTFGQQSFPLRIWIVDNSGSMNIPDGRALVETKRRNDVQWKYCTRWAELKECVRYHAQLSVLLEAPTRFRLLNGPPRDGFGVAEAGPDTSPERLEDELQSVFAILNRTSPQGATPLTRHLNEVHDSLAGAVAESYRAAGQQVVVVLATDGLPSDGKGFGGPGPQQEFEYALRRLLRDCPVWLVVRLCTDDDNVVSYYEGLDTQLELNVEVLDDLVSEAKEVYQHNPWLNYTLPLHRCREAGFQHRIFDLLDERSLTIDEVIECLRLIFDGGRGWDSVDPHSDWDGFVDHVRKALVAEERHYNPVTKRVGPWIDIHKLRVKYGPWYWRYSEQLIVVALVAIIGIVLALLE